MMTNGEPAATVFDISAVLLEASRAVRSQENIDTAIPAVIVDGTQDPIHIGQRELRHLV